MAANTEQLCVSTPQFTAVSAVNVVAVHQDWKMGHYAHHALLYTSHCRTASVDSLVSLRTQLIVQVYMMHCCGNAPCQLAFQRMDSKPPPIQAAAAGLGDQARSYEEASPEGRRATSTVVPPCRKPQPLPVNDSQPTLQRPRASPMPLRCVTAKDLKSAHLWRGSTADGRHPLRKLILHVVRRHETAQQLRTPEKR